MVAASHSGAGKTTVTGAILRALRERGRTVQAFKLGPDFIDAAYHAEATARPAINLDLWMMGEAGVRASLRRWSADADMSVVESMGGLYDGADGTEHGSAAHLAKLLGLPVVVVLDVWGMTRTTAAILDGLRAFDPDVNVAGCILNRVGGPAHAQMILDALPERLRSLIVGTVPYRPALTIAERHLGLTTVQENPASASDRDGALVDAAAGIDVDRLMRIAGSDGAAPPTTRRPASTNTAIRARLAVAVDPAFCFYYEENMAMLRDVGFDLVPFRPTVDQRLPADSAAVYLGGGYPESFATELAANVSLAAELADRAGNGMPVYAECGGLMYLARSLTGADGAWHPLVGLLPLDVVMDPTHLAIRYVDVTTRHASPLGPAGSTMRGQEFHQSRIVNAEVAPNLYDVTTSAGSTSRDGYVVGAVVASYMHLHFASNPDLPAHLLQAALDPVGH